MSRQRKVRLGALEVGARFRFEGYVGRVADKDDVTGVGVLLDTVPYPTTTPPGRARRENWSTEQRVEPLD